MKKNDIKKIKEMTIKQIEKMIDKTRNEVNNAKLDIKLGKEKNLKKVKYLRKKLAVLLTIRREKEIAQKEKKGSK